MLILLTELFLLHLMLHYVVVMLEADAFTAFTGVGGLRYIR